VHTLSVIGCGGAGNKFLDYIPDIPEIQKISINTEHGDVIVDSDRIGVYMTAPRNIILSQFPWIQKIDSEDVFLIAGLGGNTGSEICRILARAVGRKRRLWGIFTLPFEWENEKRKALAREVLKDIKDIYRGYFLMENEKLAKQYPELKIEIAMGIPAVVTKHIIVDFLRIGMKNMLHRKIRGEFGVGVGFGVGKNRIQVAIEDAMSSPWLGSGKKLIFISGDAEREEVGYVVKRYSPVLWDTHITKEYGEKIKATVIEIRD